MLGRNTNSGFVGYSQDSERVSNLASIFPIIFFLVAALACLTTMTRMVEEQRTQIGALKAMGFSRLAISKKYLGYAFFASLGGGLLGLILGCTLIPMVIANAFRIMYDIPGLDLKPQLGLCVAAVAAAVLCTTGAALPVHPDGHPSQPDAPQGSQGGPPGVLGAHQTPLEPPVLHLEGDHAQPVPLPETVLDDCDRHRRLHRPDRHRLRSA